MFISDLFKVLGDRLNGTPSEIAEWETFFEPAFAADLPDLASAYMAAASSFLFNQLTIWDRVIIWLNQVELAEFILLSNGAISSAGLPQWPIIDAVRLPVTDGRLRIEPRPLEFDQAYEVQPAPGAYLVYILADTGHAEMILKAAAAQADTRFPVAVLVKAPMEEFDGLIAALKLLENRVAGWLNVQEVDGRTNVIALVTVGAGSNEI